jgi:hypothetical protein
MILGLAAGMSFPSVALAESATVTDELGDIFPSWEISDIVEATVTYDRTRIAIEVQHSAWDAQWKRHRSATGGKLTFSNGRSYVVVPGMGGRKSTLFSYRQFRACSQDPSDRPCRPLPCTGWTYSIDEANLRTAVGVPLRCFPKKSTRVKVRPFHLIVSHDSARVIDPLETTPWIRRG